MNPKFRAWFSQGKAVEALCGLDDYLMPDVTYRDEHDFGLALRELVEWAQSNDPQDVGRTFENAILKLLQGGKLKSALLLMRSYAILRDQNLTRLPFDEMLMMSHFKTAIIKAAKQLSGDEELRSLLLLVCGDFPALKTVTGVT